MIDLTGDAGHGLYTPGKRTPDDEREWSFNDKVIRAFEEEIKQYENVRFTRLDDPTGQTDVPLKTRTDRANAIGSRVHISFHHNANVGTYWGSWGGIETFVYKTSLTGSMNLAKAVHGKMVNAYGLRDRGIKEADLHMVRETNMDAILVEGGFMDSTTDIGKLRDNNVLRNAGIAIARGVAEYLGLKRKTPVAPPQPTVQYTYYMTGGYTNGASIEKVLNFLRETGYGKWIEITKDCNIVFYIGDFGPGSEAKEKTKKFLDDNGFYKEERNR